MTFGQHIRECRRRGGQSTSPRKAAAARENGKLGGRPSLRRSETQLRDKLGLSADEPITEANLWTILEGLEGGLHHLEEASEARKRCDEHERNRVEGVANAAKEIIETGYRFLAMEYHPDLVGGEGKKMVDLNAAVIWLRGFVQEPQKTATTRPRHDDNG